MKVKNKTMVNLLRHIQGGLMYLSDSLGNMYDETNIPMYDEEAYAGGTIDLEQPYDGDTPMDESEIVFNDSPSSAASESIVSEGESMESRQDNTGPANADFEKLLEESANMVKYYDDLASQWKGERQMIVSDMTLKIIENMILCGCGEIKDETQFDMKRHRVHPYQLVANGTAIKETLRRGVEWNGKVFVPAIVSV